MRTRWRLPSVLILLAPALACQAPADDTGSWRPPKVDLPQNPAWPSCTRSLECRWGETCDGTDLECVGTVPVGKVKAATDFTLPDLNEHSQTFGNDVSLSDQHGLVTVIYFGLSTCPVCWQQVMRLQWMLEELASAGTPNATALVIDHASGDGLVWEMARYTRLPILQDPPARTVWNQYGALKDTFVVVDPSGFVQATWPVLRILDTDQDFNALRQAILDAAKQEDGPGTPAHDMPRIPLAQ